MRPSWLNLKSAGVNACAVIVCSLLLQPYIALAQQLSVEAEEATELAEELATDPVRVEGDTAAAEIEKQFSNFLTFAIIGQFELADKAAQAFLEQPGVDPLEDDVADLLVDLAERHEESMKTLLILVNNSSIGERAAKILEIVRAAHRHQRERATQIIDSLRLLAGTPMQRAVGLERLQDSGEYAVPRILAAVADPAEERIVPFLARAVPKLGRKALNPLVVGLQIDNADVQLFIVRALGEIGYPQALPYLKRLAEQTENDELRQAAGTAIEKIVVGDPTVRKAPAKVLFHDLAEAYYAGKDSLAPDPRAVVANVWFVREGNVAPIEVPAEIFMSVMAMRCCEASLALDQTQANVLSLWLAANFRREAKMGLDVQNTQDVQTADATRPADFPRSVYFARSAGPRYCQLTLDRAIADQDRPVALGAIAGLRATAGPQAMLTENGGAGGLVTALNFPDMLVRLKAALALATAMPSRSFDGSDAVVRELSRSLSLTGRQAYVLVEPDAERRDALARGLEQGGEAEVVASDGLQSALAEARSDLTHVDAIFLASDMQRPTPAEALDILSQDNRYANAPVVLYVKSEGLLVAERIGETDERVGQVLVEADEPMGNGLASRLLEKAKDISSDYGYWQLEQEQSISLALQSADALQQLAAYRDGVFNATAAQSALIKALDHEEEALRIASLGALAHYSGETAQSEIAKVALDSERSDAQRKAAFNALAESGRYFGHQLGSALTDRLVEQAMHLPDLTLRTFASKAMGAMNLRGALPSEVILEHATDKPANPDQD
jgi:HEAT repeat protein